MKEKEFIEIRKRNTENWIGRVSEDNEKLCKFIDQLKEDNENLDHCRKVFIIGLNCLIKHKSIEDCIAHSADPATYEAFIQIEDMINDSNKGE